MQRSLIAAVLCASALGLGACTNPDGTRDNRMTGAAAGAVGGGLVGSAMRGDSRGALIGAGLGATAGAVIGGMQDQQQADMARQQRVIQPTW
jgi:uncharacterized protein YcfJ